MDETTSHDSDYTSSETGDTTIIVGEPVTPPTAEIASSENIVSSEETSSNEEASSEIAEPVVSEIIVQLPETPITDLSGMETGLSDIKSELTTQNDTSLLILGNIKQTNQFIVFQMGLIIACFVALIIAFFARGWK